jgi:hypothetical protein
MVHLSINLSFFLYVILSFLHKNIVQYHDKNKNVIDFVTNYLGEMLVTLKELVFCKT